MIISQLEVVILAPLAERSACPGACLQIRTMARRLIEPRRDTEGRYRPCNRLLCATLCPLWSIVRSARCRKVNLVFLPGNKQTSVFQEPFQAARSRIFAGRPGGHISQCLVRLKRSMDPTMEADTVPVFAGFALTATTRFNRHCQPSAFHFDLKG